MDPRTNCYDEAVGTKNGTCVFEGNVFHSPDEVLAFWKAFSLRTDFTDLKIRKLNPEELKISWIMIPFDIDEPLFILDSRNHKILTAFTSPSDLKVM
jgi:hypothetical protein